MPLKDISQRSWAAFNAGDYDRAIGHLSEALHLGYSHNYIEYMSAFAHFAKDDFEAAFRGLSYRRQVMKDPFAAYPDWTLQDCDRPTLIWAPPGLGIGAEIMHFGFTQCIEAFAQNYCFAVDPRLVDRLQKTHPWARIIGRGEEDAILSPAHSVTTILSLGHMAFSMAQKPINRKQRILGASSVGVKNIRQSLLHSPHESLIGLSWRSAKSGLNARDYTLRNVHSSAKKHFSTHLKNPIYISLQHKMTDSEIRTCRDLNIQVLDPSRISQNISEFLDIISACDGGISATNSVIHLAGALGKKYLLLRKKDCPWEWRPASAERFWYSKISFAAKNFGV